MNCKHKTLAPAEPSPNPPLAPPLAMFTRCSLLAQRMDLVLVCRGDGEPEEWLERGRRDGGTGGGKEKKC